MKKIEYFCNLCGEQVTEEECIIASITFGKAKDAPALRLSEQKLALHLHKECVDEFLLAIRRQLAISVTEKITKRIKAISEEHAVSSQVKQPLDTKEVWIVANGGYDYPNLELLQICSTEETAKQFLAEYNTAHPKPFPWNQRGYVKIELDKPFRLPDEPT